MERLGLWGDGTAFKSFDSFLTSITKRGLGKILIYLLFCCVACGVIIYRVHFMYMLSEKLYQFGCQLGKYAR